MGPIIPTKADGPPRHECEFALMFRSDWTPDHLQSGPTNLYKEIALAFKGAEWRAPGLVALASKIAGSGATHQPGHSADVKKPTVAITPTIVKAAAAAAVQDDLNGAAWGGGCWVGGPPPKS